MGQAHQSHPRLNVNITVIYLTMNMYMYANMEYEKQFFLNRGNSLRYLVHCLGLTIIIEITCRTLADFAHLHVVEHVPLPSWYDSHTYVSCLPSTMGGWGSLGAGTRHSGFMVHFLPQVASLTSPLGITLTTTPS